MLHPFFIFNNVVKGLCIIKKRLPLYFICVKVNLFACFFVISQPNIKIKKKYE